jgi:hypothetical protein
MNAEKIKELREIANRDSAVSLTVRAADLRALLDEVEALRADAARYRWLRDEAHPDAEKSGVACVELRFSDWGKPYNKHFSGDALDAAIDAARHEPKDAE